MTTRFAWSTLLVMGSICLEVWCGRLGLLLAAWPLLTLYLGVSIAPRLGLYAGLCACITAEIILARTWTTLPLALAVMPLTLFWRRHGDRRYLIVQFLPAGLVGAIYAIFVVVSENWSGTRPVLDLRQGALLIAAGAAVTTLGGPILWRLLDSLASLAGLPRFYQTQGVSEMATGEETA